MTLEAIITSVIFVAVFAFILSEKIDRMVVSICGATAMIIVGDILDFYDYKQALAMIELDTIILLLGMIQPTEAVYGGKALPHVRCGVN